MVAVTVAFFIFGLGDDNFKKIVLIPDNVPISGLIILLIFSRRSVILHYRLLAPKPILPLRLMVKILVSL